MNAFDEKLIGVAWFKEEEWTKLRDVVDDPSRIEDSYDAWREGAEKLMVDLLDKGVHAEPIYIRVEELVDWCQENDRPVNSAATSEYVTERLKSMYAR